MIKQFVINFGKPSSEAAQVYKSLPSSLKQYIAAHGRRADSSDDPQKAIVSYKVDRGTSYEFFIKVLDQINAAYNEIYGQRAGLSAEAFLQLDKGDPTQQKIYEKARQGIPRAISIAEPTQAGK